MGKSLLYADWKNANLEAESVENDTSLALNVAKIQLLLHSIAGEEVRHVLLLLTLHNRLLGLLIKLFGQLVFLGNLEHINTGITLDRM